MKQFSKFLYLLNSSQKKQVVVLGILLLIGTFFEMLGLGILIPGLGVILNPNIGNEYPVLKPLMHITEGLSQLQVVLWGMGLMVSVYFLKAVFLAFTAWKQTHFSTHLSAQLSRELFYGYLKQPYHFHLNRNSAHMIRNIQGEVDQFSAVCQAVINLTTELSAVLGVAAMLLIAEPVGALVVIVFLGASSFLFYVITKNRILGWGKKRLYHDAQIAQHLMQGLGSVKDVKLLGREDFFLEKFDHHNTDKARVVTRQVSLAQIPRLYLELLAVIGMAGLVIMMTLQHKPLNLLIPTIGIFVAAAFRMIPSVNRIMASIQGIRYAGAVVNVLYHEFSIIRSIEPEAKGNGKLSFREKLEVSHLSFNYEGVERKAISDLNIVIRKEQTIGLIGPSGSGKSTLVDIILGLLVPANGHIFCDGKDIRTNLRAWQDDIGYVPQSIFLTDDSIRRNIAFGIPDTEIDEGAIQKALVAAQLVEYVRDLPEGLDTVVGERGVRLSGGQRQRIGIARALYHDPEFLFLDEATSALDSATETEVMNAVNALHGSKTIVIIAHRLSTVSNCDWLYRLEGGKVVEEGTPQTILSK